jgi:uncharacterized protein
MATHTGRSAAPSSWPARRRPATARSAPRAAAGVLLGTLALLAAVPARAVDASDARVVSVSGYGEVHAAPDLATVTLGIVARHPTLAAARAEANGVAEALLKVTRDLKLAPERVRSTRIGVNPEYSWNAQRRERQLVAYVVQRQLIVELRELDKLGELVERGVTAGANLVSEPALDSSRRADLEREALALAVADARSNAAVIARTLGGSVGAARSVTSNGAATPPRPMPMARAAMAGADAGAAPESYQSGELTFSASVSASFDLVAPVPDRR